MPSCPHLRAGIAKAFQHPRHSLAVCHVHLQQQQGGGGRRQAPSGPPFTRPEYTLPGQLAQQQHIRLNARAVHATKQGCRGNGRSKLAAASGRSSRGPGTQAHGSTHLAAKGMDVVLPAAAARFCGCRPGYDMPCRRSGIAAGTPHQAKDSWHPLHASPQAWPWPKLATHPRHHRTQPPHHGQWAALSAAPGPAPPRPPQPATASVVAPAPAASSRPQHGRGQCGRWWNNRRSPAVGAAWSLRRAEVQRECRIGDREGSTTSPPSQRQRSTLIHCLGLRGGATTPRPGSEVVTLARNWASLRRRRTLPSPIS